MLTVSCRLSPTAKGMTPWDDAIARWSFDTKAARGAGNDGPSPRRALSNPAAEKRR